MIQSLNKNPRRVFKDNELQTKFESDGYVLLDIFTHSEIEFLNKIYQENQPTESFDGFYTTHWVKSKEFRYKIDHLLRPFLTQKLRSLFIDYKMMYAYFMVKASGESSIFHAHQDWTQVDESNYTGVTFWAPLIDTNIKNGSFHIVTNSHKKESIIRGSYIPSPFGELCDIIETQIAQPVNMKAGQGLFFDQRLWHFSPPNYSDENRIAVGMVQIPEEAKLIHYYNRNGLNEVELYEGDDKMLLDFCFGDDPIDKNLKFIRNIDLKQPTFTEDNISQPSKFRKWMKFFS